MVQYTADNRELVLERIQHEAFKAQQNFGKFSARSESVSAFEKLSILGQEFGEVCQAVYEQDGGVSPDGSLYRRPHKNDLKLELSQVAGICLNWLEALEEW